MIVPATRVLAITDPSSIRCDTCGVYDPSLRYSTHPTILSFLVGSIDSSRVGLRCGRCRGIQSARAIAITLIAGWWSLRGPKLTIEAIRANLKGGAQQAATNAPLLRGLALFEYENENPDLAAMFARAAQAVQPQIENRRFLEELERAGHRIPFPGSPWRFAPFAPLVIFVLGLVAFGSLMITGARPEKPSVVTAPVRQAANAASKPGKPPSLNYTATAANSPASAARAYFKGRLQEAQKEILLRVLNGDNLWALETSIGALASHPGLDRLLTGPPHKTPYENLVAFLHEANRHYHGGLTVTLIERDAGTTLKDTIAIPFSEIEPAEKFEAVVHDPLASEEDRSAAVKALLRRELQIRATVIAGATRAIEECLRLLP